MGCSGGEHNVTLPYRVSDLLWRPVGRLVRFVVATALRHSFPEFLLSTAQTNILAKFIVDRQDPDKLDVFRIGLG